MKSLMKTSLGVALFGMQTFALCQPHNLLASWGESTWDTEGSTSFGFDVRVNDQTPFKPLESSRSLFRYGGSSNYSGGQFTTVYGFTPQYFVSVRIGPTSGHVLAYGVHWSFNSITGPSSYYGFASVYANEDGFTFYGSLQANGRLVQMRTGVWRFQSWGNQEYGGMSGGRFKIW